MARTEFDSYVPYGQDCTGTEIKYSPENGTFVCDPFGYPESVVKQAKAAYLERATYELRYQHPENVPGSITKIYRVDVSPNGDVSHEEIAKPQ